jgi:hypothetical protein
MATVPQMYDSTQAVACDDLLLTLAVVMDEFEVNPKYNAPREKLQKAYQACLELRVMPTETPEHFRVESSQDAKKLYEVSEGTCTCEYGTRYQSVRYGCHHTVAAAMYQRWQQNQRPLMSPLPGKDVSVATMPLEPLRMPQDVSEVRTPIRHLALPRRSIVAIVSDLSRPLPEECLGTFTRKGVKIPFLPWPTVADLLDAYAPGWSGAITRVEKVGAKCAVTYRLTIPAAEGDCTQEDGGMEDEAQDEFGDAMTNAIATAFKRTAAKFGVGRWLYDKENTARPLAAHLKAQRTIALAELGKAVDAAGLEREPTITWLRRETGVESNAHLPLAAIRALTTHLSQ